jgi:hypothetical protein
MPFEKLHKAITGHYFDLTAEDLVTEDHVFFPFLEMKPSDTDCDLKLMNNWGLCSTSSPKLVHLQENLCRNAVRPSSTYA